MQLLSFCLDFYLSPVVKEAKYKNLCISVYKGALTKFNKDDIGETLLEAGLNIDE